MNWLDVLLLLIVVVSVIGSFKKGMSRQVIHLASVLAGIILGAWFYKPVAALLEPHVNSARAASLGGFLIVFFGVLLVGAVISSIVGKFLRVTGLSFVDHLLGAVFGLARGVLIAVGLLMGVMAFAKDGTPPQAVEQSKVAPYVSQAARVFVAMAPRELKDGFQNSYAQAKTAWNQAVKKASTKSTESERKR